MRVLKSKYFWGGVVTGAIIGPWFIGKVNQVTGIGIPSYGGGG